MSKIKNILIGGIAAITLGALPLLSAVNNQYQKAEAAVNIDMTGYTKLTSANLNIVGEGTQVYMVANSAYDFGVNMSNSYRRTKSKAELTVFTINEVKDGQLAISYNGKYLSLVREGVVFHVDSVSRTYVDIDSHGYLYFMLDTDQEFLANSNTGFKFNERPSLYNLDTDAVGLFVIPKAEMSAMNQLAYTILNEVGCDSDGVIAPSSSDWSNIQTAYNALSDAEKLSIKTYAATEGDVDVVKSAMAKYDYIMSKYKNRTAYPNYLERSEGSLSGLFDGTATDVVTFSKDNTAAIVVTISAAILSATIVSYFVIRKKKQD